MYNLYHPGKCNVDSLSQTVIEAMAVVRQCSTEKRAARAILYTSYSKKKLEKLVEQLQDYLRIRTKKPVAETAPTEMEGAVAVHLRQR